MKEFDLSGRSALVTGSTQGIGQGIALSLRQSGASIVYHGLESSSDVDGHYVSENLLQLDAPARLMEQAFDKEPALDILVCNAGRYFDVTFLEMGSEAWENTFNLNVRATYFLIQAFSRRLVEEKRSGSVIIIGSTNGLQAEIDSTAYDSSKGAVTMMTRTLALNLARHGIRVNCLAPGLIRTPQTERWIDTDSALRSHYEKNIPLGRIGDTGDCGGTAVYLASTASTYVTGQIIAVDGGLTVSQIGPI